MKGICQALNRVREKRPLIHNITNLVVMNTTANILLALGASPVMAHAREELEEMLKMAHCLVINIGTLDSGWISSMELAAKIAGDLNKPVVMDPVGAGATSLRTETALRLLQGGSITVLRGNFSEIASLLGRDGRTRGVDSSCYDETAAPKLASVAAREFDTVVAVTGPTDFVSNGREHYAVHNGHPLLERVTGTGCMVTATIGAFTAVEDALMGTLAALTIFGIAAEKAYEEAKGPGSFSVKLVDWVYAMNEELIRSRAKVERVED